MCTFTEMFYACPLGHTNNMHIKVSGKCGGLTAKQDVGCMKNSPF